MDIKDIIKDYFGKQKDVLCVYLFGSAAIGRENKFSDVDIAVLFDSDVLPAQYTQKRLSIMDDLSSIFDRDVDVVVLNNTSSFLKFQVIKNGIRVYERQGRVEHNFETKTIMEYFDFLPIRKRLEATLINNIKAA